MLCPLVINRIVLAPCNRLTATETSAQFPPVELKVRPPAMSTPLTLGVMFWLPEAKL